MSKHGMVRAVDSHFEYEDGTWNMTRNIAKESANGFVEIELPGKPYMAILATAIN